MTNDQLLKMRRSLAIENNALRQELAKQRLKAERLQAMLDARPALNDGLYDAYVRWSAQVGEMEFLRAVCTEN
jgi:hypothetical protein